MRVTIAALVLVVLPLIALAQTPEEIRAQHREAAASLYQTFSDGMKLTGAVEQNESEGTFEAWFFGDEWYVTRQFGELVYYGYGNTDDQWYGSNFSLPYKLDPEDHPADTVMNMFNSGDYLEDPLWQYFVYESEDAGGFNFSFEPPGMPKVKIVLYSDPEDPYYLQVMSSEVAFSESDPESLVHRSYYYYDKDGAGRLYNIRETGRDLDQDGTTVSFTDYEVTGQQKLDQRPAELDFSPDRVPVGGSASQPAEPVVVDISTEPGYFMVPLTFEGTAKTFWFIFDTGASASMFTEEAATAAKIEDSLNVSAHGHNTRVQFDIGMCSNASVGEADAKQHAPLAGFPVTTVPETSGDLLAMLRLYGASGILGNSPLHQYVITLDEPQQQLVLYPPQLFDKELLAKPNIEFWIDVESLVFATGTLNGELKGDVVIDTGLQQELAILSETVDAAGLELEKVDERNSTVVGGLRRFDIVRVPKFELGPIELEDAIATMTSDDRGDMSARGLLGFVGFSLFKGARITLDFFGERMYIEQPQAANGDSAVQADEPEEDMDVQMSLVPGPLAGDRG